MPEKGLNSVAAKEKAEALLASTKKPAHIVRKPGAGGFFVTQEMPHSREWNKQKLEHVETIRAKLETDRRRK